MKNDAGPAFPVTSEQSDSGILATPGMSLRDYFAAAAMRGWLASWPTSSNHPASRLEDARSVAKYSYAIADAMIAEREGQ